MKIKLDTKDLEVGMYVAELDRPWLETPFLFQGFAVTSQGDINELQRCCEYVFIDEEKGSSPTPEKAPSRATTTASVGRIKLESERPPHPIPIEEEMVQARKIRVVAEQQLSDIMQQARAGKAISAHQAHVVIGDMIESLIRSPDAMVLLGSMKSHEREAEAHAINVSILSITLGRFLKLPHPLLEELGVAALLHNVGETMVPVELLRKHERNAEETALVRRHTEFGAEILGRSPELPESAAEVALSHHERVDGKGYPRGLKADEIGLLSKIVALISTYDELTRGNSEVRIPATEALRNLYLYRDKLFDAQLTEAFIQCLGIYPVGSLVEMETGEVGIVLSVQPGELLHPRLLLVRGRDKKPYERPHILNLAVFAKSDPDKYKIKHILAPDAYGVDIRAYLLDESLL